MHCGIDFLLDFDGRYWDVDSSTPPLSPGPIADQKDDGTIELVSRDVAEFRSESGSVVRLRRSDGPKDVGLCS